MKKNNIKEYFIHTKDKQKFVAIAYLLYEHGYTFIDRGTEIVLRRDNIWSAKVLDDAWSAIHEHQKNMNFDIVGFNVKVFLSSKPSSPRARLFYAGCEFSAITDHNDIIVVHT